MTIEAGTEQFKVGNETSRGTRDLEQLVAETRHGENLARALIEHILRMQAAGYNNEVVVDGENWIVEVKRRSQAS